MSAPVIAFLGWDDRRTFLVYHLAWMYAVLGYKVVAMDLNPQASLTASFLPEEKLGKIWYPEEDDRVLTIEDSLQLAFYQVGVEAHPQPVGDEAGLTDRLSLIVGDPRVTHLEREISSFWIEPHSNSKDTINPVSDFSSLFQDAARQKDADLVLADLGFYPSLIARAAWTASSHEILAVSTDPLSVRGLETLGAVLSQWRISLKPGTKADPDGYVVLSGPLRIDQPSHFLETRLWTIPELYRDAFLEDSQAETSGLTIREDPYCLGVLREPSSLLDTAREVRKPVFLLKPSDGAIGSLALAVQDAYRDFERLALRIAGRVGLPPIP